jgi:hypothetical protein
MPTQSFLREEEGVGRFWDRVLSLSSSLLLYVWGPGWTQIWDPPASATLVLGLEGWATIPDFVVIFIVIKIPAQLFHLWGTLFTKRLVLASHFYLLLFCATHSLNFSRPHFLYLNSGYLIRLSGRRENTSMGEGKQASVITLSFILVF